MALCFASFVALLLALGEGHRVHPLEHVDDVEAPHRLEHLDEVPAFAEVNSDDVEAPHQMHLRAVHHNPHWECFGNDPTGQCQPATWALFSAFLLDFDIDFGSLLMGGSYTPPAKFSIIESFSQYDKAAMVWNNDRWALEENRSTEFEPGRAGILGRFRHRNHSTLKLVVASLHYGHTEANRPSIGAEMVGSDIAELSTHGTANRVLILADTNANAERTAQPSNRDPVKSVSELATELGMLPVERTSFLTTPALPTCCADWRRILGPPDNETWRQPFDLSFDRIFSNFGERLRVLEDENYKDVSLDYQRAPRWAEQVMRPGSNVTAAYHHPVLAELAFSRVGLPTSRRTIH